MIDREALERDRTQFQRDTVDGQLARLRANLDIVATRLPDSMSTMLAKRAVDQTAWYCEWAFVGIDDEEIRLALAECQRFAARCRNHWEEIVEDAAARARVAAEAGQFSERFLALFGVLRSEAAS